MFNTDKTKQYYLCGTSHVLSSFPCSIVFVRRLPSILSLVNLSFYTYGRCPNDWFSNHDGGHAIKFWVSIVSLYSIHWLQAHVHIHAFFHVSRFFPHLMIAHFNSLNCKPSGSPCLQKAAAACIKAAGAPVLLNNTTRFVVVGEESSERSNWAYGLPVIRNVNDVLVWELWEGHRVSPFLVCNVVNVHASMPLQ